MGFSWAYIRMEWVTMGTSFSRKPQVVWEIDGKNCWDAFGTILGAPFLKSWDFTMKNNMFDSGWGEPTHFASSA